MSMEVASVVVVAAGVDVDGLVDSSASVDVAAVQNQHQVVVPSCWDQALHVPAEGVVHEGMAAAAAAAVAVDNDVVKVELDLVDNLHLVHHDVVVVLVGVEEEAVEAEE